MGSKEINDFTVKSTVTATDEYLLQETSGGTTKKTLVSTIRDYILGYVTSLSSKSSVVSADELLINDSAASGASKKVTVGTLGLVPSGVTLPYVMTGAVPSGYLLCDGSPVSRTTYSGLFAVISTTYGVGDGSTTFNLPDFQGQFLRGFESGVSDAIGTKQDDAMQRITGSLDKIYTNTGPLRTGYSVDGVFSVGTSTTSLPAVGGGTGYGLEFDSDTSTSPNAAKTDDVETRPTNYAVQWIIKT